MIFWVMERFRTCTLPISWCSRGAGQISKQKPVPSQVLQNAVCHFEILYVSGGVSSVSYSVEVLDDR